MKKMSKSFYLLLILLTIMTIGSVFTSFAYAKSIVTPKTKDISTTIKKFNYESNIPQSIKNIVEFKKDLDGKDSSIQIDNVYKVCFIKNN